MAGPLIRLCPKRSYTTLRDVTAVSAGREQGAPALAACSCASCVDCADRGVRDHARIRRRPPCHRSRLLTRAIGGSRCPRWSPYAPYPRFEPDFARGQGNQRQIVLSLKPQKQAKFVAVGCHWLRRGFHGKEGVDRARPLSRGPGALRDGSRRSGADGSPRVPARKARDTRLSPPENRRFAGVSDPQNKRMMGLEPTASCMASGSLVVPRERRNPHR